MKNLTMIDVSSEKIEFQSTHFASPADFAQCRKLHKEYGTTYYLSSRIFPEPLRSRTDAIYGFVRTADEFVDNPNGQSKDWMRATIDRFRAELQNGVLGRRPESAAMRAFVDVLTASNIPIEEPMMFLDAMAQDIDVDRYPTMDDLNQYMRGSAASVGMMMAHASETPMTRGIRNQAIVLANAMQMTNFLRDIQEDAQRGRIYLPLTDLEKFEVPEGDILNSQFTPRVKNLIEFEIERTRQMYLEGEKGIPELPKTAQKAVLTARILYSRILDRIEMQGCNVFAQRARTSKAEKLWIAAKIYLSR